MVEHSIVSCQIKKNKELKCDELGQEQVEEVRQTISVIKFSLEISRKRYASTDAEKKRVHIG